MKVFKFGGASVKNAEAVVNVGEIIKTIPLKWLCLKIHSKVLTPEV
jgi:hypothetical protein